MPPSRRRALRSLVAAASLPALGAWPRRAMAQSAAPLTTLHVASAADDTVTPVLYALHAGLFAAAGLDVVLQKANSGSAVAAAVASGAMDFGRGTILPLISAYARGVKFVLVAASTLHVNGDPDSGLLVLADAPLRSARDLDGKIVSVAGLYDLNWLATNVWLDANGAAGTTRFIEIPNSAVLAALQDGRIAAGTLSEPFMSLALHSGKARYFGNVVGAIAPNLIESAWYTNADFAAKNRELVARFRHVVEAATVYTNAHRAETVDLLAAFTGMDAGTIGQIHRAVSGTTLDPKLIQPMIDAAAKFKMIPQGFAASALL
jgi:ABC-type nitrate/sulfonate/bicarbonate transport system substrate-binding protein